jgi:DNA-binding IclR family transcriptional regulator
MRSVERVAAILTCFTMARPLLTLTEVAQAVDLDKNTTRRLLIALSRTGLVQRNDADGTYGLGIQVLKLQPAVVAPRELRETAAPYLQGLTEKTGMTSFFWLPDTDGAICIERVRASGVFLEVPWSASGRTLPFNIAAGPRVVLGYLDDATRTEWLSRPQPAFTQYSLTDTAALLETARRIHAQGYEIVANDLVVGLAGLGVPVFDRQGAFVGSVSVTSRSSDFDDPELLDRVLSVVRDTAAAIGVRLGEDPQSTGGKANTSHY